MSSVKPQRRNGKQLAEAERLLRAGASFADVAKALNVKYQTLYARITRQRARALNAATEMRALEEENELLRASLAAFDSHPNPALADVLTTVRARRGRKPRGQRSKDEK